MRGTSQQEDDETALQEILDHTLRQELAGYSGSTWIDCTSAGKLLHRMLLDAGLGQFEPEERTLTGNTHTCITLTGENNL